MAITFPILVLAPACADINKIFLPWMVLCLPCSSCLYHSLTLLHHHVKGSSCCACSKHWLSSNLSCFWASLMWPLIPKKCPVKILFGIFFLLPFSFKNFWGVTHNSTQYSVLLVRYPLDEWKVCAEGFKMDPMKLRHHGTWNGTTKRYPIDFGGQRPCSNQKRGCWHGICKGVEVSTACVCQRQRYMMKDAHC